MISRNENNGRGDFEREPPQMEAGIGLMKKDSVMKFVGVRHSRLGGKSNQRGFSLLEMLFALAIFSIAVTVIYGVMNNMSSSFTLQEVNIQAQQLLRAGSELMVHDIRMAGYNPTGEADVTTNIKPGITVATAQRLQFTSDLDASRIIDDVDDTDGVDSADFERMEYVYDGADRIEQVLSQSDGTEVNRALLLDDITNLRFTYFDEDNTNLVSPVAAASLEDIRTVAITMTIQKPAGRRDPVTRTYTTTIACRNLGLE